MITADSYSSRTSCGDVCLAHLGLYFDCTYDVFPVPHHYNYTNAQRGVLVCQIPLVYFLSPPTDLHYDLYLLCVATCSNDLAVSATLKRCRLCFCVRGRGYTLSLLQVKTIAMYRGVPFSLLCSLENVIS